MNNLVGSIEWMLLDLHYKRASIIEPSDNTDFSTLERLYYQLSFNKKSDHLVAFLV